MVQLKLNIRWKLFLSGFVVIFLILTLMGVFVSVVLKRNIDAEAELYRRAELERVRQEMKNHVDLAAAVLDEAMTDYVQGNSTYEETKQRALMSIGKLRYDSGAGYFWINNTDRSAPTMIMHPLSPSLNGRVLDDPKFNCTLPDQNNLYQAIIDQCSKNGAGFVVYRTVNEDNAVSDSGQPRISYVKMYEPLNWIIGTEKNTAEVEKSVAQRSWALEHEIDSLILKIVGFTFAFLLLAFFPLMLVAKTIVDPIQQCIVFARKVGGGDLSAVITYKRDDETGMLADSLNGMVHSIRTLLMDVRQQSAVFHNASTHLANYSSNMSDASKKVSEQSSSVAAAAEQVSGNVASVSDTIRNISLRADNIAENAKGMSDNVNSVAASVEEISHTVKEVARHCSDAQEASVKALHLVDRSCEIVSDLDKAAENVGQVINLINDITEQTKLLALNATIEAARAGQAGRGFSVVANEVKELANQAAGATDNISGRIKEIQQQTTDVVKIIQDIAIHNQHLNEINTSIAVTTEQQAATTVDIARVVGEAARNSEEVSREVNELTQSIHNDISSSIREASQGVIELSENIQMVNSGVKEGASASAGNYVFSKEMTRVAAELKKGLNKFHIGEANFNIGKVKAAHLAWRTNLEAMLHRGMELSLESLPDHTQCDFGRWIASPEGQSLQSLEAFPEMFRLHEKVHVLAYDIADLYHEGSQAAALDLMEEFEETRKRLFDSLDKLYRVS